MRPLFVMVLFLVADIGSAADNWPGFRGKGDSVSDAKALPIEWSATDKIAWKVETPGYGQSSPVVWKDRVFVTAVAGDQRDQGFVLAYDLKSGKELWRHQFEPTQKAKWSFTISKAAPTPAVDADAVYAFFEGGNLLAFRHDGTPLWSRSLVKDYGEFQNNHGLGGSPVLTNDAVVVLVDDRGPSYLLAVDKKTGKNLWKKDRPERGSWTSPTVSTNKAGQVIIISSAGTVSAHDAKSGETLWLHEGLTGNTIPSASVVGDRIVVGAGIARMGGDAKKATRSNCCLQMTEKDGMHGYEVRWVAEKAVASYASPLAYQGHAYFVNQAGVCFCLDLETGKERFAERIDGPCWASPIGAGGHIYFFGKDGTTTVLKAGPEYSKVASNSLWDKGTASDSPPAKKAAPGDAPVRLGQTLYGVAAIDGAFLVRSGTMLYRIGKQ